jgi:hypothetical protein
MDRQARWQKGRKDLPWAEKIRMMERVRRDYEKWLIAVRKDRAKVHAASKADR